MTTSTIEDIPLINLVGPPNSGKTTLFNLLSGKNLKTVNYPGSTVEYSTSDLQSKYKIKAELLDTPGIISLIPNSIDEEVSVNSLYSHPKLGSPHLVINTVDASQLSRHLLLTLQLIDSGFRVVVVLTMNDILSKKNLSVSAEKLSEELGCDVVKINGRNGEGIDLLVGVLEKNLNIIKKNGKPEAKHYNLSSAKSSLIDYYKRIENIQNKVYESLTQSGGINLEKANKELKVVSTPYPKVKNTPDELTLKVDRILLHRFWGLVIFIFIMALTFTSIFWLADPLMVLIDQLFSNLSNLTYASFGYGWFSSLIADGIISGMGSVLVFIPQIIILFLILGVLEDSGYLARGAMLIDKPLSKIGLNGRSFVPMLSGFACAIPAILAARTIPNRRERLLTIFIIPLMSCSARLPVYALLIAFLTPLDKPWIGGIMLAAIYILSIIISIVVAAIINRMRKKIIKAEDNSSFILELPTYKRPKLSTMIVNTYSNTKQYVVRAGPIIFVFSIILWFLTYFPNIHPQVERQNYTQEEILQMETSARLENSYAADIGKVLQPVMRPLGMDWRIGVSLLSTFAAREVFVSSLALIFRVTDTSDNNLQKSLLNSMKKATIAETGEKLFTPATIMGLIVFFIFALQCISTLAISRKETGSWRIPMLQLFIFSSTAYIMAFITVNGLRLIGIN